MSSLSTRESLLETAWSLLRRDPSDASMARIAAEAGVSRQAVYLHFRTRAGLLLALVRWIDERERIAERFQQAAQLPSPAAVLTEHMRVWLDYLPRLHPVPRFLSRAVHDPAASAAWNDRMTELEKVYRRPLRALHAAGALRKELTAEQALALVRAIVSVDAWDYLVNQRGWRQEQAVASIICAVQGAVLKPTREPVAGSDRRRNPTRARQRVPS